MKGRLKFEGVEENEVDEMIEEMIEERKREDLVREVSEIESVMI